MMMSKYLENKLKVFGKALKTLEEALNKKKPTKLEKDGAIQRYEYCFELAWKCLKIYLQDQGIQKAVSPKTSFASHQRKFRHLPPVLQVMADISRKMS